MNPTTYEAIDSRLTALELQLGIKKNDGGALPESDAVAARISRLHSKIDSVYASNPELQHMPDVMKRFQRPGDKSAKLIEATENQENVKVQEGDEEATSGGGVLAARAQVDDFTKQEVILIKQPQLLEFCDSLKVILAMEIPTLTPELYKGVDPSIILEQKNKIEAVAGEFDLLLAKHLIILEKYSYLINSQSLFWKGVQDTLREATVAANAAAESFQTRGKY